MGGKASHPSIQLQEQSSSPFLLFRRSAQPRIVVDKCHAKGITTIAIADHDHVGGIEEAADYARGIGMEVVPL